MGLLDDIMDKAKGVANVATKKTKEVVGYSKLKIQAMQITSDVDDLYEKLGRLAYEEKKANVNNSELIASCISDIDNLLLDLAIVNQKITENKASGECPNCNAHNAEGAVYCQNCGTRMQADNADIGGETYATVEETFEEQPAQPQYTQQQEEEAAAEQNTDSNQ